MPEGISEGGILLGEVLQASWLTQAFLGIAVKGSGAMYGVAVDLCPRRHSPPSAAGPFYRRALGSTFHGAILDFPESLGFTSSNLK
jgi:hypothetical protein